MKRRTPPFLAVLILSAAGLLFVYDRERSNSARAQESAKPIANAPPILLMERTNWFLFDPYNRGLDLSKANTFEMRSARWKAALAFEFPAEYAKRFPLTPEQYAATRASAIAFEHPLKLQEFLKLARTPEEQQTLERALDSFVNPKPATESP